MATKKFTELNNYPSGSVNAATDVLAIVDIASDESKKITVQNLGGAIGIPTLQQVTDQGSITTVAITGSSISASADIKANNINCITEISSSTLDVANNSYIGGDLQVVGSVTGSALNLYGVDYKPWTLLGSARFNVGGSWPSGDKIGIDFQNNTGATGWPNSNANSPSNPIGNQTPFQIYWNPDLSGQGEIEMSVRVLSKQDNIDGFQFGLFDGVDGFLSSSATEPWTEVTNGVGSFAWNTATISGSDFSGKAFSTPSTDRILELQSFSNDGGNYYGIAAIQIWAKKI